MNLFDCTTPEDFFEEGDPSLATPWSQYDTARYAERNKVLAGESDTELAEKAFAKLRRHRPGGFTLLMAYSYGDALPADALMLYVAMVEKHGVIAAEKPADREMRSRRSRQFVWTIEERAEVVRLRREGVHEEDVAARFGKTKGQVRNLFSKWQSKNRDRSKPVRAKKRGGCWIWTPEEKAEVARLIKSGVSNADVAERFGKRIGQVEGVMREWRKANPDKVNVRYAPVDYAPILEAVEKSEQGLEAASKLGLSLGKYSGRLYRIRRKMGVPLKKNSWTKEQRFEVFELYKNGMSKKEISIKIGRTRKQVQDLIYRKSYTAKKKVSA